MNTKLWLVWRTLVLIFIGLQSVTSGGEVCHAEIVDGGTQRHGMHSCPIGQFVVGVHVDSNLLLCSGDFGTYSEANEIIDYNTQFQGMHACPEGWAMSGLHVDNNQLACAPVTKPLPRFVDTGTQRSGMHACPEGNPASGIHVDKNQLLCGTTSSIPAPESVDVVTQRHGMHSCPLGQFVVGVHVDDNLLLCSSKFGTYPPSLEIIDYNTQFQGMHACPEGWAMTGLHVDNNQLACAPVTKPLPRFVDTGTQRSGMHACPEGNPASGIHVDKNQLTCGTETALQEVGVDRPGGDYRSFSIASPALCKADCDADPNCKAYTYVITQGGASGHCWLKSVVPPAVKNDSCISGFKGEEVGIDRPGKDLKPGFDLTSDDPHLCKAACDADPRCKAYTYVKPNTIQGPKPRCWLKEDVPAAVKNDCCISGLNEMYGCPANPEKEVCQGLHEGQAILSVSNRTSKCADGQLQPNFCCCEGGTCVEGAKNDHIQVKAVVQPDNLFTKKWKVTPLKDATLNMNMTNCKLSPSALNSIYEANKEIEVEIIQEITFLDNSKHLVCMIVWTIQEKTYSEHFSSDPPLSGEALGCLGWTECLIK